MKINTDDIYLKDTQIQSPLFKYLGKRYGKEWNVELVNYDQENKTPLEQG